MKTITYNIPNINCGNCVNTIQMEVGEMTGVAEVHASAENKQVKIVFDAPADETAIKALLAEINFPVVE